MARHQPEYAAKSASLKYDPLGRLFEASTSSGVTRFVYDGDRLIAEYASGGTVLRRYVHGAGVDEPLVWYEGAAVSAAQRRYLHADHQGSIIAATNATGAMLQVHAYDAYGITGAGNTARFQYTGQAAIPELGLYYYKARFYNPALGRFMQTDPIGYDDDLNLYAYVKNDPLNGADPIGMAGSCTGSRVGAGCDFVQGSEQRTQLLAGHQKKPKTGDQQSRPLTSGEHELGESVYQDSIPYDNVRIIRGKYLPGQDDDVIMTPDGNMYAPAGAYRADFSLGDLSTKGLFIHELAHVLQYYEGVNVRWEGFKVLASGGYAERNLSRTYGVTYQAEYLKVNIEQQAELWRMHYIDRNAMGFAP